MKALIIGDSHAGILKRGHSMLGEAGRRDRIAFTITPIASGHIFAAPFLVEDNGRARLTNPAARAVFPHLPPTEPQFDFHGISAPLHSARVFRHADWARFRPGGGPGFAPVSQTLLQRAALDDQRHMLSLIEIYVRLGLSTFVIEPPRPFRHHPAVAQFGAALVAHVDRVYRDTIKAWLRQRGVMVVEVPPDCLDADGFMIDAYRFGPATDLHHASFEFGMQMMSRISTALSAYRAPIATLAAE